MMKILCLCALIVTMILAQPSGPAQPAGQNAATDAKILASTSTTAGTLFPVPRVDRLQVAGRVRK